MNRKGYVTILVIGLVGVLALVHALQLRQQEYFQQEQTEFIQEQSLVFASKSVHVNVERMVREGLQEEIQKGNIHAPFIQEQLAVKLKNRFPNVEWKELMQVTVIALNEHVYWTQWEVTGGMLRNENIRISITGGKNKGYAEWNAGYSLSEWVIR